MKKLLLLVCWTSFVLAHPQEGLDETIERDYHPAYLSQASGSLSEIRTIKADWPVEYLSIGHTIASYQNYGGKPYFHHGIDIRANAGSPIRAARGGRVVNIENYEPGLSAYWEVAVLDADGYIWQYHHIEPSSIPEEIRKAYKNKSEIAEGTKLGEVFYWNEVTFGERFHHIHLNVLGKDKTYLHPFLFLKAIEDQSAPTIDDIFIIQRGKKIESSTVKGEYSIAIQASDLVHSNKFTVPPHVTSYQIEGNEPVTVWNFDTLPGGSSNVKYIHDFFVPRLACGNYSCRRSVIDLGFRKGISRQVFPSAPGSYRMKVRVQDFAGNQGERDFEWVVGE